MSTRFGQKEFIRLRLDDAENLLSRQARLNLYPDMKSLQALRLGKRSGVAPLRCGLLSAQLAQPAAIHSAGPLYFETEECSFSSPTAQQFVHPNDILTAQR